MGATGGKGTVAAEVVLGSIRGPLAVVDACVRRPWRQVVAVLHRPGHAAIVALATSAFAGLIATRRVPSAAAVWRALAFGVAAVGVSYPALLHPLPAHVRGGAVDQRPHGRRHRLGGRRGGDLRRVVPPLPAVGDGRRGGLPRPAVRVGPGRAGRVRPAVARAAVVLAADVGPVPRPGRPHRRPVPTGPCPNRCGSCRSICGPTPWCPRRCTSSPTTDRLPPILAAFPRVTGQDWRSAVRRDGDRLVWRTPPCNCPAGQALAEADTILLRVDSAGPVTPGPRVGRRRRPPVPRQRPAAGRPGGGVPAAAVLRSAGRGNDERRTMNDELRTKA